MKTSKLLIGTLAIALSFSACQNKTTTSETGDSTMDMSSDSSHNMESTASNSPIMEAMDKMMKDMHQVEMSGNADHDLISMLIAHHQGAVDMAKAEIESGTEPKLKEIAQKIADKQSKDIDMLQDMLKSADKSKKDYDPAAKQAGLGKDMDDNMNKMMEMNHESSGSVDHEFATMMIKHHKDGMDMGNIILKHAKMPEFKSMAQKMIEEQKKEIAELEQAMSAHQ